MTEDTKPSTVKDRRHLNASGELREEAASAGATPASPAPVPEGEKPTPDAPRHYPTDFAARGLAIWGDDFMGYGKPHYEDKWWFDLEQQDGVLIKARTEKRE